jgi:hypothetical protein
VGVKGAGKNRFYAGVVADGAVAFACGQLAALQERHPVEQAGNGPAHRVGDEVVFQIEAVRGAPLGHHHAPGDDRALALPLHTLLDEEQVQYIVKTLKDTATNVGAGAAIYL